MGRPKAESLREEPKFDIYGRQGALNVSVYICVRVRACVCVWVLVLVLVLVLFVCTAATLVLSVCCASFTQVLKPIIGVLAR